MFDAAVIVLRWVQMTGAMILFGSPLFFLYALPAAGAGSAIALRLGRPLLIASAATIFAGSLLGLLAQTVVLAGSVQDGFTAGALGAAVTQMSFGKSVLVRAAFAALALVGLLLIRPARGAWRFATFAGAVICGSFAWMGHGAATEGTGRWLHLASDILHTLAAGVWIGALVVLLILLAAEARRPGASPVVLHQALRGFSGVGSAVVAILLATGLVNGWFVIGPAGVARLWTSAYGLLLTLKLVFFAGMTALAAANRLYLTPRLGAALGGLSPTQGAAAALRNSLALETGLSIGVLGLVAWFGMLAPPGAS